MPPATHALALLPCAATVPAARCRPARPTAVDLHRRLARDRRRPAWRAPQPDRTRHPDRHTAVARTASAAETQKTAPATWPWHAAHGHVPDSRSWWAG